MNAPSITTNRLRVMYDARAPQPSSVWNQIKWVQFTIPPRSRFMHAVKTLQKTSPVPVFVILKRLANNDYAITVTRVQLENIVAQARKTPISQI